MRVSSFLSVLLVGTTFCLSSVLSQEATATAADVESHTSEGAHAVDDSASALDVDATEGEVVEEAAQAEEQVTESQPVESEATQTEEAASEPVQSGPLIDLFGPQLLSLELIDETSAQISANYTNEALAGKKVIGLYFSADWCGPCRQFTPELVSFYEKINNRRGKKDEFQIVWISRCRDVQSYANYFAHMPWLALPPEEAMGARGQWLGEKYKVKGIPSLTLIDDLGQTITTDARNKVPQDKAGIGFPWRNPVSQLYNTLLPRSLRHMVKVQIDTARTKVVQRVKNMISGGKKPVAA